jgi:predicted metal-binding protein
MKTYHKYIELAKALGALGSAVTDVEEIVIDARTLLKCMYGCSSWNHNWTCPSAPGALKPWEFERILKNYKKAILVRCDNKELSHKISFEIEKQAFIDGYYFAFSLSDCSICSECSYPDEPCRDPRRARPSMQAVGIDVFSTVRAQGLPIKTLANEEEKQNWYSLILIE